MGFLRHIERCNRHNPGDFVPFFEGGRLIGRFRHPFAERLAAWPEVFRVDSDGMWLNGALKEYGERSRALGQVLEALVGAGEHPYILGEAYPITPAGRGEALCEIDRSAASLFGIRTFGQHLNGYVVEGGEFFMWVAKRATDRRTYPGMLDQMVAGGIPAGLSLGENLRKECWEEAGIPAEMVDKAVPVGALSYNVDNAKGYKYDVLYCYDLELPADFSPRCTDGEVDEFRLEPVRDLMERVLETDQFKPNCNLVVIDFLLRRGFIGPEHDEYLDLVTGLRPAMANPWRDN
ncbi:MAG: DUF4743 domain-containing protein [Gammaproteobacteria bacterium]|nr:DUF4743 domain-containing protein [Gammaproteobacteria bacterium]MBU1654033.1 DUF4743 domain-containing protein [Gammaproteobacteria bacterium]MBU1959702.1 DUF4743 domain-containing protein [Gammaproteobacteria bacterium]